MKQRIWPFYTAMPGWVCTELIPPLCGNGPEDMRSQTSPSGRANTCKTTNLCDCGICAVQQLKPVGTT
ncbi:hypothetical protein PAMP_009813 [Pampus punctatissimus]